MISADTKWFRATDRSMSETGRKSQNIQSIVDYYTTSASGLNSRRISSTAALISFRPTTYCRQGTVLTKYILCNGISISFAYWTKTLMHVDTVSDTHFCNYPLKLGICLKSFQPFRNWYSCWLILKSRADIVRHGIQRCTANTVLRKV